MTIFAFGDRPRTSVLQPSGLCVDGLRSELPERCTGISLVNHDALWAPSALYRLTNVREAASIGPGA